MEIVPKDSYIHSMQSESELAWDDIISVISNAKVADAILSVARNALHADIVDDIDNCGVLLR